MLLKNPRATGILYGAWGFTFCLHYRTWAWRFEEYMVGALNELQTGFMYVLASTMIISLFCFAVSLAMNWPQRVIAALEKWCRLGDLNTRPHHYE